MSKTRRGLRRYTTIGADPRPYGVDEICRAGRFHRIAASKPSLDTATNSAVTTRATTNPHRPANNTIRNGRASGAMTTTMVRRFRRPPTGSRSTVLGGDDGNDIICRVGQCCYGNSNGLDPECRRTTHILLAQLELADGGDARAVIIAEHVSLCLEVAVLDEYHPCHN